MKEFHYLESGLPADDGYYMPAEFSEHEATIMIFPERKGSWCYEAKYAEKVFKEIIGNIASFEKVYVLASEKKYLHACNVLKDINNIEILKINSDDAWARDTAPTFVINSCGNVRGIDWAFNAWGGLVDGLYANWQNDDKIPVDFCSTKGYELYDAHPFVLEGGSIHSDGEGTLITTEECLLSQGRNPLLSKKEIEDKLKKYLGISKIIWLKNGIYNDETNGHVDNICAFIAPGEVVLAWTDDESDPQYIRSKECLDILENSIDAKGRKIKVHKLNIPKVPVCVGKEDLLGYEFEEGEDTRELGERLAASYVNFYFCNNAIILPQFGGDNEESDIEAVETLKRICKDRHIIPVYARDIILGGGNIHCITSQIPKGEKKCD